MKTENKLNMKRSKLIFFYSVVFMVFLLVIFTVILNMVEKQIHTGIANQMQNTVKISHGIFDLWMKEKLNETELLSKNPQIVSLITQLAEMHRNGEDTVNSDAENKLREAVSPWMKENGIKGYCVLSKDGKRIASMMKDDSHEIEPVILQQGKLEEFFNGEKDFILPFMPETSGSKHMYSEPFMFITESVRNSLGEPVAVFATRLDPRISFASISALGRLGRTGDFYIFNKDGKMISRSRFESKLEKAGLIGAGETSILNIKLTDPGKDIVTGKVYENTEKKPLTKMAGSALSGTSGIDMDGYRNYMGVEVIGAWEWDGEQGLGFAFEMAKDEACATYYAIRAILFFSMLSVFLLFIILLVVLERKKYITREVEKNLQENESRLKEAQSMAKIGSWELNLQTGESRWSDEMFRILGLNPKKERSGFEKILERIHPDDRENFETTYRDSVSNNSPFTMEHRLKLETGEIRYAEHRGKTELGQDKVPVRSIGTVLDITERVDRESRVQELTERLQLATNVAGIGIWDWNIPEGELYWDENMVRLFGLTESDPETNYHAWEKIVHPDDKEQVINALEKAIENDIPLDICYRICTPEMTVRYMKTDAIAYKDSAGRVIRLIGTSFDTTDTIEVENALMEINEELEDRIIERTKEVEKSKKAAFSIMQDADDSRKQAEIALEKLKESQGELQKLSRAIEASPVSVVVTDKNSVIEYVNPYFLKVTGYSIEEVLGKKTNILKSGNQSAAFYKELWKTLSEGEEWQGEFCNRNKAGEIFWEMAFISPVRDADGEVTHFVAVKEDITKKKKAERDLHDALEKAEEATVAKSEFLANMSHEIRTPMNAIIGMSHLALMEDLTPQQRDFISKISTSAKSLLNVINDILDFSKIEARKLNLEKTTFNLSSVLESVVTLSAGKLETKNVELLMFIDENIPQKMMGDPVRVGQVFTNLLENAAKFTEKGEVEINVEVKKIDSDNIVLESYVADTGIGMSREQVERIFQKFSQADTSTTRKYGGTGLGLAICQQLVELMGGEIRVESEKGVGSKFIFTLQFGCCQDMEESKTKSLPVYLRGMNTLLAGKHKKTNHMLERLLQSFSFDVEIFNDSKKAAGRLTGDFQKKNPIDFIMIEYKMLKQDDWSFNKTIKEDQSLSAIPLVVVAGMDESVGAEIFAESYKNIKVLQKPVTQSALFNSVADSFGYENLKIQNFGGDYKRAFKNISQYSNSEILLVEDNEINQQVATELLKRTSAKISLAKNGREALEMIKEKQFDLVLMDIQMPVMDGISAVKEVRRQENADGAQKRLPIVAMTAHAMAGDREKGIAAGMDDYMTKPIDPAELYKVLGDWLVSTGNIKEEPSADKTPEDLPQIKGVNTKDGLERMGGSREKYESLLERFVRSYTGDIGFIRSFYEDGDMDSFNLHVHTVKGSSGNIGAYSLHKSAVELEETAAEEPSEIMEKLEIFEKNMSEVCTEIKNYLSHRKINKQDTGDLPDSKKADEMISRLMKLLKQSDFEAKSCFKELKGHFLKELERSKVDELEKYIERYDFENALSVLEDEQLVSKHGGEL